MHELADEVLSHVRTTWRYRSYAVVFAWVIGLGGWIAVFLLPDRYEATARVYVNTQGVLRPLLAGLTVQPNVDQMVGMMGQTLVSRPNLEKLIQMADMDADRNTPEDREQLITRLTKDLTIKGAGRENLYVISYTDKNPQEAKRVVQALLTLFVEGTLGDQRKDSESARTFIDDQLKAYNDKLVAAEKAMTDFRRRNMGLMVGDRQDYYTRLVQAQTALSGVTLELKESENSRDAIKKQLNSDAEVPAAFGDNLDATEIDARIQSLEQKRDGLRLNYTEQHPDLVAIERIIFQLKEQKKAESKRTSSSGAMQVRDPLLRQQLSVSLITAEANVAALKARVAEYTRRYDELKATAHAVPQVDAEYTQLTRDYEVTKKSYENLLARRESAQISGDMETRSNVMDFKVVDPPQVPSVPKAPNRGLLMSLVLLVALAGGVAGAFLVGQSRPTINDEHRLSDVSGLPVLGTIVMAWTKAQERRRVRGLVALGISFAGLLSTYVAIMAALLLAAPRA